MANIAQAPMHLQASVGQAVHIELTSSPGAGVVWQLPGAPAGCTLSDAGSVPDSAGVGGSATQRFVLTCSSAGTRQLRFELKRPWEAEVRATQAVNVAVS